MSEQGDARSDLVALRGIPVRGPLEQTATAVPLREVAADQWPLSPPRLDIAEGDRIAFLSIDPETGQWMARVGASSQRIEFASPAFRFRVDLPAWILIALLPLAGIGIGLLLSIRLSRSVTRPVSELAEAARAIGKRELGYRVRARGSRELADLAESFNRMAEALERAETVRRHLMADVAHELRTPLTVLEGNVRAMLDGVRPLEESRVAALLEETHHLRRLVEDLRLLMQAEVEQLLLVRTTVDLAILVRETNDHFGPLAEAKGIALRAELDGDLVHPALDADRVLQVLHNLVANALAHTSRGGTITIAARRTADPPAVSFAVQDDGEGISPEALAHVFDRFYRSGGALGRDRGGAGLGLVIVRAIVQAHAGSVTAESMGVGRGSRFTVVLPLT